MSGTGRTTTGGPARRDRCVWLCKLGSLLLALVPAAGCRPESDVLEGSSAATNPVVTTESAADPRQTAVATQSVAGEAEAPGAETAGAALAEPPTGGGSPGPGGGSSAATDTAPAGTAGSASGATAPPGAPAPAQPLRQRAARRGEAREISFDDIKFEMVKGDPFLRTMLTPPIEALAGQRVRIRGYMLPSFQQSGLKQFVLVRDNMQCCFGPGAALYDCVVINMKPGKEADYSVRPVAVEGTFGIRELLGPDGKHLAIYEMAGEAVN